MFNTQLLIKCFNTIKHLPAIVKLNMSDTFWAMLTFIADGATPLTIKHSILYSNIIIFKSCSHFTFPSTSDNVRYMTFIHNILATVGIECD